jgi:hypothetical protein
METRVKVEEDECPENEEKESVLSCLESEIAFEEGTVEFRATAAECQRLDEPLAPLVEWFPRGNNRPAGIKQVGMEVKWRREEVRCESKRRALPT